MIFKVQLKCFILAVYEINQKEFDSAVLSYNKRSEEIISKPVNFFIWFYQGIQCLLLGHKDKDKFRVFVGRNVARYEDRVIGIEGIQCQRCRDILPYAETAILKKHE